MAIMLNLLNIFAKAFIIIIDNSSNLHLMTDK